MNTQKTKRTSTTQVLAATFGWDSRELGEYRYQPTRTARAVYAIGERYFTVSATQPDVLGFAWRKHSDQFWADKAGTTIWVADATEAAQ